MNGMARGVDVSSRAMRPIRRLAASLIFLAAASSAPAQIGPPRTMGFPFAVGAGGEFVNDTGSAADVEAFSNGAWHAFGELVLEKGVLLQARYMAFSLPGTPVVPPFGVPTSAPDVKVRAGIMSVGYVFREPWWDAGFVAGVGVYGLSPNTPTGDQASADVAETVIGWHAGLLAIFHVATRWDLRLEATGYLLRTDQDHKPITIGGSVAYHF